MRAERRLGAGGQPADQLGRGVAVSPVLYVRGPFLRGLSRSLQAIRLNTRSFGQSGRSGGALDENPECHGRPGVDPAPNSSVPSVGRVWEFWGVRGRLTPAPPGYETSWALGRKPFCYAIVGASHAA